MVKAKSSTAGKDTRLAAPRAALERIRDYQFGHDLRPDARDAVIAKARNLAAAVLSSSGEDSKALTAIRELLEPYRNPESSADPRDRVIAELFGIAASTAEPKSDDLKLGDIEPL